MSIHSNRSPDFLLAGFQKCATTWLHVCLREHPQLFIPEKHMLHFFDIHYDKGLEWYGRLFDEARESQIVGDTTVTYARDPRALERIVQHNPHAKIILSVRNPVDRAFSHYWHEKKKRKITFRFEELFDNYDLFDDWVRPGRYYERIQDVFQYFHPKRVLILLCDDFPTAPEAVFRRLFEFLDVLPEFVPPSIKVRHNAACHKPQGYTAQFTKICAKGSATLPFFSRLIRTTLYRLLQRTGTAFREEREYKMGITPDMRQELVRMFTPDVQQLAHFLGRDLNHWLQ